MLQASARKAAYLVPLSVLPRRDAARLRELYCRDRPVHYRQDATGTAKVVRRDVDLERLPDGPEGRCSVGIVVVHRRDACLAARPGGIGRAPKGHPDERETVARTLEHPKDVVRRVLRPRDVLPLVHPALNLAKWDAAVHRVWLLMRQALSQRVSPGLATTPAPPTE